MEAGTFSRLYEKRQINDQQIADDDDKKKKKKMVQEHREICRFPEEIILKILSKSPVKSLLRFKRVCKSWYNLITDPYFVKLHLHQSVQDHNFGFIISCFPALSFSVDTCFIHDRYIYYFTNLDDDNNSNISIDEDDHYGDVAPTTNTAAEASSSSSLTLKLYNPMYWNKSSSSHDHPGIISGSCNGLLLLVSSFTSSQVAIWNPSTRDLKELPLPFIHDNNINEDDDDDPNKEFRPCGEMLHGLGYDPKNDDYKVIKIFRRVSLNPNLYDHYKDHIIVYSSRSHAWRKPRSRHIVHYRFYDSFGTYMNGVIHFLSFDMGIVGFDCVTEDWKEFDLPHDLLDYGTQDNITLSLLVRGECLSVIRCWRRLRTEVYVMNEYGEKESWCKITTISHTTLFDRFFQLNMRNVKWMILCALKSDEFLLWGSSDNDNCGKLVLYNYVNGSIQEIKVHTDIVDKKFNILSANACISSVVSLEPPYFY